MIYHYNQPLSNRSSPAVYFFYVPLVSFKSFSVGSKKHNQTTCCSVIHGQCHLKLLKWYFAQLSSTGIGVKMLLWDYWANASHIESAASYETSFGQPAHFYTLGIFLHETNPNDNNWTDESLPEVWNTGLQKCMLARWQSLEEPEDYLWINGKNVACFPTEKMTRKTSKRCTQREFTFKVIAFLSRRRSLTMLFRYCDIDVHIKRKKGL